MQNQRDFVVRQPNVVALFPVQHPVAIERRAHSQLTRERQLSWPVL
ncbi:hypothetical protein [Caballeronia sp. NK8]|nr:hypothetical protein [Caballeronia sp. NK8]